MWTSVCMPFAPLDASVGNDSSPLGSVVSTGSNMALFGHFEAAASFPIHALKSNIVPLYLADLRVCFKRLFFIDESTRTCVMDRMVFLFGKDFVQLSREFTTYLRAIRTRGLSSPPNSANGK